MQVVIAPFQVLLNRKVEFGPVDGRQVPPFIGVMVMCMVVISVLRSGALPSINCNVRLVRVERSICKKLSFLDFNIGTYVFARCVNGIPAHEFVLARDAQRHCHALEGADFGRQFVNLFQVEVLEVVFHASSRDAWEHLQRVHHVSILVFGV
jgi:hypothetical protein